MRRSECCGLNWDGLNFKLFGYFGLLLTIKRYYRYETENSLKMVWRDVHEVFIDMSKS